MGFDGRLALCPGMQPGQEDAEAEAVEETEWGCHRRSVAGSGPSRCV